MKAVIYARYSSDNQREESIEGQLRECRAFAEKTEMTIVGTYIDRALSAKTDDRPEFQKMIKDSSKKLFDTVIVWKLDRFARNRHDSAKYKSILRMNDVRVISATEAIAEDSTGILLEAILEGYAEFFSAELAEKVFRGMKENVLKGKYNGSAVPLGYRINSDMYFEVDPLTAPVVKEIFQRYDKGEKIKPIMESLIEKGILTTAGRPFTLDIVNRILKNRKYIGEYEFRDIVAKDVIPVIVELDLFNRVQDRLEKNKYAPARNKAIEEKYLLTTKLHCGDCGSFMVGESGTSSTGVIYRYYKCSNAKKRQGCKRKAVKKDWIEDLVIKYVMAVLFDDEIMEDVTNRLVLLQQKENTALPLLKKQLAETQKNIDHMLDAIQDGLYTKSTKNRLEQLEERKTEIEKNIIAEEIGHDFIPKDKILFWLHKLRDVDINNDRQRQRLVDTFINAVYIYDDRLVLSFNYKDGTKTISLNDIQSSDLSVSGVPRSRSPEF